VEEVLLVGGEFVVGLDEGEDEGGRGGCGGQIAKWQNGKIAKWGIGRGAGIFWGWGGRCELCGRVGFEPAQGGGEDEALGGPAGVDDDEVYAAVGGCFGVRGCVEDGGAFHDDDAGVVAECPGEDAVAGVQCVDAGGAVVEEAVCEAAGGAAEVCGGESGDGEVEVGEGVVEFEAASGDEGGGGRGVGRGGEHWELKLQNGKMAK
jgi:hypothetical protein